MFGAFHGVCGIASLSLGALIFLVAKGTRTHIRVGWGYVTSMSCLNGSSLFIYHLTGGPNIFHALAIADLIMVWAGVLQARYRARLRNWLWRHYQYMSWSYVGLLAATSNEAFVRLRVLKHLTAHSTVALPLLVSALIVVISAAIIFRKQNSLLARWRSHDGAQRPHRGAALRSHGARPTS